MARFKPLQHKEPAEGHEWEKIAHIPNSGSYWRCNACLLEIFMDAGKKPKAGQYQVPSINGIPIGMESFKCTDIQALHVQLPERIKSWL